MTAAALPFQRGRADPTGLEMWRRGGPVGGLLNVPADAAHVASPGTTNNGFAAWRLGGATPLVRGRTPPTRFATWRASGPAVLLVSQIGDNPPMLNNGDLLRRGELPRYLQTALDSGTLDYWRRGALLPGVAGAGDFDPPAVSSRRRALVNPGHLLFRRRPGGLGGL